MTAVEWLQQLYDSRPDYEQFILPEEFEQAKQMEKEKCIQDYNAGYDDAQCNHINDAENYSNEK